MNDKKKKQKRASRKALKVSKGRDLNMCAEEAQDLFEQHGVYTYKVVSGIYSNWYFTNRKLTDQELTDLCTDLMSADEHLVGIN